MIVDNQSLRGTIARALSWHDPGLLLTAFALVVVAVGLAIATLAGRSAPVIRRAEAWDVICTSLVSVLESPISWTHYWAWCVPMLVVLCAESYHAPGFVASRWVRRSRILLVIVGIFLLPYLMWVVPKRSGLGIKLHWKLSTCLHGIIGPPIFEFISTRRLFACRASHGG